MNIHQPLKIVSNLKKKNLVVFWKNNNLFSELNEKSGIIGRDKNIFITIADKDISRNHCEIIYKNEGYYLHDNKSMNGTYVFFPAGIEIYLKNGTAVMIGNFLYEFKEIKEHKYLEIAQYTEDLKKPDKNFKFELKRDMIIGKAVDCDLKVEEDDDIDDKHAVLSGKSEGKMIVVKALSSSGLWLKLNDDDQYPLKPKTEFRVGTSFKFTVTAAYTDLVKQQKHSKKCCICNEEENNAIIFPCKHKVVGPKCLKQKKISACPECFAFIQNYLQIFT